MTDLPRIISMRATEPETMGGQLVEPFRNVSPLIRFGAIFSDLADRRYMSEGHCLMYLHRRVANVRAAKARSGHFFGRIYNAITGSADDYVALTGHVFDIILKANGEPRLNEAQRQGDYALRLDVAEEFLSRFTDVMRAKGALQ